MRVHPRDCVLVEDTLEHQKSARGIGMRTVWMQRWLRPAASGPRPPAAARPGPPTRAGSEPHKRPGAGRPAYVDRRIRRLVELLRR